jgi:hypothetical protein
VRVLVYSEEDVRWVYYKSAPRRTSGACTSLQQGGYQVRVLVYSKEDIRSVY